MVTYQHLNCSKQWGGVILGNVAASANVQLLCSPCSIFELRSRRTRLISAGLGNASIHFQGATDDHEVCNLQVRISSNAFTRNSRAVVCGKRNGPEGECRSRKFRRSNHQGTQCWLHPGILEI